jgi:pSer/pThr/pTyr-binding forkhead associated (FHA) protein
MPRWRLTFELDVPLVDGSTTRSVELVEGEKCLVGRSKTAQVSVASDRISREHLAYEVIDGQLFVEDLGSSNGSWFNGQKFMRRRLDLGDKVYAGTPRIVVTAMELLEP